MIENKKGNKNKKLLIQTNQALEAQCKILRETYNANEALYHDMKHHLQAIYFLAEKNHDTQILEYISEISQEIQECTPYVSTGVDIVDAIINHKRQLALEKGISFEANVELPVNTGIASDDFCVILSNLLDNALEALTRQPQPDSTLHLTIRRIHQFLLIQVTNPCPDNISTRTSKADKRHHGWGLKNVKKIVQKYHGSLEYKVENHSFVVTAMLFFNQ